MALRVQEGTILDDKMFGSATTADGNVVLAGYTIGDWDGVASGRYNTAAVKLNAEDGEEI